MKEKEYFYARLCLFFVIVSLVTASFLRIYVEDYNGIIPVVNNTIENLKALKSDCEKDLPRSKECVMVYDFAPVNKE